MLRIKEIRERKKLTQDDVVRLSGIKKRSYVDYEREKVDIPLTKLQNIVNALEVSVSEILGEDIENTNIDVELGSTDKTSTKGLHSSTRKRIPYYDTEASGSFVPMFNDTPETPAGFLEQYFDDCDFAMNLWGHSMFPDYNNGDVIVLKQLFDKDQILYGEAYLIVTDELRTVKYLRKSDKGEEYVNLVPKNTKYHDAMDLHKEKITQIFMVKGKVVRHS